MLCLSILTYVMIVPRFKEYSFALVVPVVHQLIIKHVELVFLPFIHFFGPIYHQHYFTKEYSAFLGMVIFWLYYVVKLLRTKAAATQLLPDESSDQ